MAEWIEKQDPSTCYLQETRFTTKDIHKLKVRNWEKYFRQVGEKKKAVVARFVSEKMTVTRKKIT